jgi:hypothetical protein
MICKLSKILKYLNKFSTATLGGIFLWWNKKNRVYIFEKNHGSHRFGNTEGQYRLKILNMFNIKKLLIF